MLFVTSGLVSAEPASSKPTTLRPNSTQAICIPKQIPRNGTSFSRAKRIASIFPSIPRSPKPPGTKIPSAEPILSATFSAVNSCESTQSISISESKSNPACFNASTTEI